MKSKKLVIVGAGEFADIAYEYFTYDSEYQIVGFSVHEKYIESKLHNGLPIVSLETINKHFAPSEFEVFVAVPATQINTVRKKLFEELKEKGYRCATYVSSKAFVWRNAIIGENCFIFENNTVQPFVTIEDNTILWSGNHIGHRTVIKKNCFISSHAVISGYCLINEGCFIGVNSTFNDHTSLPPYSILGSGSVVTKKLLDEEAVYIGNPAKAIPRRSARNVKL